MSALFALRLKEILESRDIQQKEIASALELSPSRFSAYIRNKSEPGFDMLVEICTLLNVSSDYLIGLTDCMRPARADTPPASSTDNTPVSKLLNASMTRNRLAQLDPDLLSKAEGYLDGLFEMQKERDAASQQEA